MNKSGKQIVQAAQHFAKRWTGKDYEKGKSQLFILYSPFITQQP